MVVMGEIPYFLPLHLTVAVEETVVGLVQEVQKTEITADLEVVPPLKEWVVQEIHRLFLHPKEIMAVLLETNCHITALVVVAVLVRLVAMEAAQMVEEMAEPGLHRRCLVRQ